MKYKSKNKNEKSSEAFAIVGRMIELCERCEDMTEQQKKDFNNGLNVLENELKELGFTDDEITQITITAILNAHEKRCERKEALK